MAYVGNPFNGGLASFASLANNNNHISQLQQGISGLGNQIAANEFTNIAGQTNDQNLYQNAPQMNALMPLMNATQGAGASNAYNAAANQRKTSLQILKDSYNAGGTKGAGLGAGTSSAANKYVTPKHTNEPMYKNEVHAKDILAEQKGKGFHISETAKARANHQAEIQNEQIRRDNATKKRNFNATMDLNNKAYQGKLAAQHYKLYGGAGGQEVNAGKRNEAYNEASAMMGLSMRDPYSQRPLQSMEQLKKTATQQPTVKKRGGTKPVKQEAKGNQYTKQHQKQMSQDELAKRGLLNMDENYFPEGEYPQSEVNPQYSELGAPTSHNGNMRGRIALDPQQSDSIRLFSQRMGITPEQYQQMAQGEGTPVQLRDMADDYDTERDNLSRDLQKNYETSKQAGHRGKKTTEYHTPSNDAQLTKQYQQDINALEQKYAGNINDLMGGQDDYKFPAQELPNVTNMSLAAKEEGHKVTSDVDAVPTYVKQTQAKLDDAMSARDILLNRTTNPQPREIEKLDNMITNYESEIKKHDAGYIAKLKDYQGVVTGVSDTLRKHSGKSAWKAITGGSTANASKEDILEGKAERSGADPDRLSKILDTLDDSAASKAVSKRDGKTVMNLGGINVVGKDVDEIRRNVGAIVDSGLSNGRLYRNHIDAIIMKQEEAESQSEKADYGKQLAWWQRNFPKSYHGESDYFGTWGDYLDTHSTLSK